MPGNPVLTLQTASLYASNDASTFTGTGGPFGFSPFTGQFGGVVSSAGLAGEPFADTVYGVTPGDIVTFVVAVQNMTAGAAAYGVRLKETMPPGFMVPTDSSGIDLSITDGAGNDLAASGDLFGAGLVLTSPIPGYDPNSGLNIALITFTLQASSSLPGLYNSLQATAALTAYTAVLGGPDLSASVANASTTIVTAAPTPVVTPETDPTAVAKGQTVAFDVALTVPAGTLQNLRITPVLPGGTAMLNLVSTGIITIGTGLTLGTPQIAPDGSISFGNVTASATGNNVITVRIVVRADGTASGPATLQSVISAADPNSPGGTWSTTVASSVGVIAPPAPPVLSGLSSSIKVTTTTIVHPFGLLTIADNVPSQSATLAITLRDSTLGQLSNAPSGTLDAAGATFVITGTIAAVVSAAQQLLFTPAKAGAEQFTLTVQDGAGGVAQDASTLVTISPSPSQANLVVLTYAQALSQINVLKASKTAYVLDLSTTPEKYAGPTLQALGLGGTAALSVQFSDGRLVFNTADPVAQVYRMYLSALGRVPEPGGQHSWAVLVESGVSLTTMAQAFIQSPEFIARYGSDVSDRQFVTLLYQNVLGRAPDSGGLNVWLGALTSGQTRSQMLVTFSECTEHIANSASAVQAGLWDLSESAAQIARLYDTMFGRIPDAGGLATWTSVLSSGMRSLEAIANSFVGSAEFQIRYGSLNNADLIARLYVNALRRTADPAGQAYWVAQLNAGTSQAAISLAFSESAEHQASTAANILNASPAQQGILTSGPVLAAGAIIGANLDALESQVQSGIVTSLTTADSGVASVPVTAAQLTSDKDALSFITGNFAIDMSNVTSDSAGASAQAANLGTSTAAKYVQFANGRLVFDVTDRAAQVYRMYDSAFGRTPDMTGEHAWSQVLATGTSLTTLASAFIGSAEFTARYGAGLSNTAFVTQLYQNTLRRAPDLAGLNAWVLALNTNSSRAQLLTAFSESSEHIGNTASVIKLGIFDIGAG